MLWSWSWSWSWYWGWASETAIEDESSESLSLSSESLGGTWTTDGDSGLVDNVRVASSVGCAAERVEEAAESLMTLPTAKSAGRRTTNRYPSSHAIPSNRACGQYLSMNSRWGMPMAMMGTSSGPRITTEFPFRVTVVMLGGESTV